MKRNHLSLAIGLSLSLAAPLALAQETAPAGEDEAAAGRSAVTLDAIQVTARKREETLQDVPVAVTAFTPESLDKLNIQDLGDLDAQVPNLTIYAARGSSSTVTAYIRGIGQSDPLWGVDPGVGIYFDDVYIARPQGALLDVLDVERIEVLRGPQGTLYGKNTIGGAIKYITRGLPTEFGGTVELTAGNYGRLDAKAAVGGPIGGEDSGLRARFAIASLNHDGFGRNLYTGQDVSDKEINVARLQLGAFVTENFDIQFSMDWLDDQSGVRGGKMLAPNLLDYVVDPWLGFGQQPLDDRYDIRSGMPNVNDTEMKGASATVNWRINDDFSLKYVIAKRESDTETNIDFDMLPNRITDVLAFYSDQQVSNEIQLNYDGGGRSRGVIGFYQFDGDAGGQVLNNFANASFGDTRGTVYTESIALYGDWTIDLTDKWSLDLGARYTDEDKRAVVLNRAYLDANFDTVIAVPADFDKTVSFSNISPRISLGYQVNPDILVYGLASRGFKSGGYNIRANAAVPHTLLPFDDESVDSFEVGAKMGLLDQRLFLNLSAFHNRYEDIQLSVFTGYDSDGDGVDDAFLGDFTNAGKGTVNGIEVEYQWLPNEHWLISGNLAWLDAEYDEFISAGANIADTQVFSNAPEFSGALNVEWRTGLANGGNFSARVTYAYQSEVYPTTDLSEEIKQPGYGLLSAGLIWQVNDAWTFSLQGTNLTDKEYRTTGYNIPALGILTGFYGPPRQYSLTARYNF